MLTVRLSGAYVDPLGRCIQGEFSPAYSPQTRHPIGTNNPPVPRQPIAAPYPGQLAINANPIKASNRLPILQCHHSPLERQSRPRTGQREQNLFYSPSGIALAIWFSRLQGGAHQAGRAVENQKTPIGGDPPTSLFDAGLISSAPRISNVALRPVVGAGVLQPSLRMMP